MTASWTSFAYLLFLLLLTINLSTGQEEEESEEYDESEDSETTIAPGCSLSLFRSKALQCIKDFDKMTPGKSEVAKCCVYLQLVQCSVESASDVCTNSSIVEHLEKQRKIVRISKCTPDLDSSSWYCFWLVWESVITFGIVLVIIAIMMLVCTLHSTSNYCIN